MSELSVRMELLKTSLQAFLPARVITRDLGDFAMREASQLQQGVFTLVSKGEGDYANFIGRMAAYSTRGIAIIGQIQIAEGTAASAIEDAEGSMIDDIKQFARSALPAGLGSFAMLSVTQSQQLEHPYGWVLIDATITED